MDDPGPGEGGTVRAGTKKIGAYRDDGVLHTVSTLCTHLGCSVVWNGRRGRGPLVPRVALPLDGTVLEGPAVRDLKPVDGPPGDPT